MGLKSVRDGLSAEPADASKVENDKREKVIDYEIDDVPPWHLGLLLAFQVLSAAQCVLCVMVWILV